MKLADAEERVEHDDKTESDVHHDDSISTCRIIL